MPTRSRKGSILVSAFDGTRQLIPNGKALLFNFRDGRQKLTRRSTKKPQLKISLPFADNRTDDYAVVVSGKGYRQAGFHPVALKEDVTAFVDLMLLPKDGTFRFRNALWKNLRETHSSWTTFLKGRLSEASAEKRHGLWMEDKPEHVAAFLNFAEAMADIHLRERTAFDYLKTPLSNDFAKAFEVDRMYAWADRDLVQQLEIAEEQGTFVVANSSLHPGATRSFKEVRFGEANIQVTLHEDDTKIIEGKKCIKVEIDMDYFRDLLAHALLEVLPNQFGGETDPRQIYVLRWIAGRRTGISDFNPPFEIA